VGYTASNDLLTFQVETVAARSTRRGVWHITHSSSLDPCIFPVNIYIRSPLAITSISEDPTPQQEPHNPDIMAHPLFDAPPEILLHILSFLDYKALLRLQSVCRSFKAATLDSSLDDEMFRTARSGHLERVAPTVTAPGSFQLHPVFNQLSYACGNFKDFRLFVDNQTIDITTLPVLKEAATSPPVKTLGAAWTKFWDGRVHNCAGKAGVTTETGVTVEQILRKFGRHFGQAVSDPATSRMGPWSID
jgi:hypothetical protein